MPEPMALATDQVLSEAKARLAQVYGLRFRGLVLHGSEARGEAGPDSDIDLLVLLDGPVLLGQELDRIIPALYPLQWHYDRPIHAFPADIVEYERGTLAVYRFAKEEGQVL